MKDILKCYVSGRHMTGQEQRGVVTFAVPDYGIFFRCLAEGTRTDLEIVALFSFLRFAEHNIEIFKKRHLQILTDFPVLAYLMNHGGGSQRGIDTLRREARKIAKSLRFTIALVDSNANRAAGSAFDLPAMPTDAKIKIKTFAGLISGYQAGNQLDGPSL